MLERAELRRSREQWKREVTAKCADCDFVSQHVLPHISPVVPKAAPYAWSLDIVRALSTGRVTLRYEISGFGTVYGKAYYDTCLGRNTYELLQRLWQNGFGPRSQNQVPQPLAFVAEGNLMLLQEVRGAPLTGVLWTAPLDQAVQSMRAAALWLARFHASDIPGLDVEPPCERMEIMKVADVLAKVAAKRREYAPMLVQLLRQLDVAAEQANPLPRLVPLHDQYRPAHVFVADGSVVVIDVEKIRLSDPAKDVARFVHTIKKLCFETGGGDTARADRLAEEFTREYASLAPENLENLPYFRAAYTLRAFAKALKSRKVKETERKNILECYRQEFERCLPESAKTLRAN